MSAFKQLFTLMIEAGGDESKLPADLRKKDLQVFVKESKPYFLVSDSYFYVPAYFTSAALTEFKQKFSQITLEELETKVIVITKWNLELRKASEFTSYAGLECRLIVHSFKPLLKEKLHPTRFPTNLYRDDEFKTTIQHFRHNQLKAAAEKSAGMAPLSGGKGAVSQGIIEGGAGEWQFKAGKTAVVSHAGKAAPAVKAASAAPKVKGGAKHHAKAAAKAAGKSSAVVAKVLKATPKSGKTPSKAPGKESARPKTAGTPDAGKKSTNEKGGMTMKQYQKFLQNQKAKAGKASKK
jgi:hypothetical protein